VEAKDTLKFQRVLTPIFQSFDYAHIILGLQQETKRRLMVQMIKYLNRTYYEVKIEVRINVKQRQ